MGSEFSADELFRYRVDKKMIAVSAFCQLLEARYPVACQLPLNQVVPIA